jgi:signal transduction histidine kinase
MKGVSKSAKAAPPDLASRSFERETMLEMNEALLLGSVRQHELTETAQSANAQLQEEISAQKLTETGLHRVQAQLSDRAEELEELVTERTAALTATNQQLEAFVYSIAHDLRAPLRAMQGFSELLVEEAGATLSEQCTGYADRINKAAQFMDAMLRDLLDFSRISQQHVELTAVNLATLVESVLSSLTKDIQDKGARVERPGPWPMVLAHEATLIQVLFNLTSNALKFVRPGVPPQVRLRAEERGEFVRVWVEDNGEGIAPDYQEQIFRLFMRLHGETYPGTGIGLGIVQKGIERMGGHVGVESAPGAGSRFWFELRKA